MATGNPWVDAFTVAAAAGGQYALNRTDLYNQARTAENRYDVTSEAYGNYINKLKNLYSSELSGELTTQELQNRDLALETMKKNVFQTTADQERQLAEAYARSGLGGDALSGAIRELRAGAQTKLGDYEKELNAYLLDKAATRAANAKNMITQAETGAFQATQPLEAATEAAKGTLRSTVDPASYSRYLISPAIAAGVAGIQGMMEPGTPAVPATATTPEVAAKPGYQGPNPLEAARIASVRDVMKQFNLDPAMFASPASEGKPYEEGGYMYTPKQTRDFLGNVTTTYEKGAMTPAAQAALITANKPAAGNLPTTIVDAQGNTVGTVANGKVTVLPKPAGTGGTTADKKLLEASKQVQKILSEKVGSGKGQKVRYDQKNFDAGQYQIFTNQLMQHFLNPSVVPFPEVKDDYAKWTAGTRLGVVNPYQGATMPTQMSTEAVTANETQDRYEVGKQYTSNGIVKTYMGNGQWR